MHHHSENYKFGKPLIKVNIFYILEPKRLLGDKIDICFNQYTKKLFSPEV